MEKTNSPNPKAPSPASASVDLGRRAASEFFGTFTLVVLGCGAVVVNAQTQALGHPGVAASFGLVVAAVICATGHVSGAHINPAVSLAFASLGRLSWRDTGVYLGAQLGGAVAGAGALKALFGTSAKLGATLPSGSVEQSFWLEFLMTGFLMFVVAAVATDKRAPGALASVLVGGTVTLEALVGGPISGASMNPARSLGPALVAGVHDHAWLYVVAPVLGALVGAWLYMAIRGPDAELATAASPAEDRQPATARTTSRRVQAA